MPLSWKDYTKDCGGTEEGIVRSSANNISVISVISPGTEISISTITHLPQAGDIVVGRTGPVLLLQGEGEVLDIVDVVEG